MIPVLSPVRRALRRLLRNEAGAATVEFAIVFPFFIGVFISAFEVAMMNMRAVMLERATDLVVRDVRLASGDQDLDYDEILTNICAAAGIIPDCINTTQIEMQPVDTATWGALDNSLDCIKREEDIDPVINFVNGQQNELMLIRVCAVVDPIFPTIGVGRSMPLDDSGGYRIVTSSAFVNEPK
ncbi:MAG: pilus assembly protein [Silicimonas sp.]|nr:pilus assembly protein [Silicimonas sp.]